MVIVTMTVWMTTIRAAFWNTKHQPHKKILERSLQQTPGTHERALTGTP